MLRIYLNASPSAIIYKLVCFHVHVYAGERVGMDMLFHHSL